MKSYRKSVSLLMVFFLIVLFLTSCGEPTPSAYLIEDYSHITFAIGKDGSTHIKPINFPYGDILGAFSLKGGSVALIINNEGILELAILPLEGRKEEVYTPAPCQGCGEVKTYRQAGGTTWFVVGGMLFGVRDGKVVFSSKDILKSPIVGNIYTVMDKAILVGTSTAIYLIDGVGDITNMVKMEYGSRWMYENETLFVVGEKGAYIYDTEDVGFIEMWSSDRGEEKITPLPEMSTLTRGIPILVYRKGSQTYIWVFIDGVMSWTSPLPNEDVKKFLYDDRDFVYAVGDKTIYAIKGDHTSLVFQVKMPMYNIKDAIIIGNTLIVLEKGGDDTLYAIDLSEGKEHIITTNIENMMMTSDRNHVWAWGKDRLVLVDGRGKDVVSIAFPQEISYSTTGEESPLINYMTVVFKVGDKYFGRIYGKDGSTIADISSDTRIFAGIGGKSLAYRGQKGWHFVFAEGYGATYIIGNESAQEKDIFTVKPPTTGVYTFSGVKGDISATFVAVGEVASSFPVGSWDKPLQAHLRSIKTSERCYFITQVSENQSKTVHRVVYFPREK